MKMRHAYEKSIRRQMGRQTDNAKNIMPPPLSEGGTKRIVAVSQFHGYFMTYD